MYTYQVPTYICVVYDGAGAFTGVYNMDSLYICSAYNQMSIGLLLKHVPMNFLPDIFLLHFNYNYNLSLSTKTTTTTINQDWIEMRCFCRPFFFNNDATPRETSACHYVATRRLTAGEPNYKCVIIASTSVAHVSKSSYVTSIESTTTTKKRIQNISHIYLLWRTKFLLWLILAPLSSFAVVWSHCFCSILQNFSSIQLNWASPLRPS